MLQTQARPRPASHRYHRWRGLVLPSAPTDVERASYIRRALPFLTTALTISAVCVTLAQGWFEARALVAIPFALYTLLYFVYQALSLPVNFTGRSFDMAAHERRFRAWRPRRWPTVDIFLPVCGEPMELLCNTWAGVQELVQAYPGRAQVYVLDDGDSDEAMSIVPTFGFTYIRRPVHEFKKAGNLNYAFQHTNGEHIVVFDADFRPRADFLAETLPYLDDPEVGIVQTPQFFRVDERQTWIERAAGASLEVFYRTVQVARDRFGSALCVGSNAVYRRSALIPSEGFTVIPYAEDSHTGLDMRYYGFQLVYLPVVLAAGVCPATIDGFMRQQYRWCCGATSLIWTDHMWRVPMSWMSRLPYIAGWLWNLTTAVRTLVLPLIPITLLVFLPGEVQLRNAILLIPTIVTSAVLYPLWHNTRWPLASWPLAIAVGWAQALALWDFMRGRVMSWEPSRGPKDANRRFRKAVLLWNGTLAVTWVTLSVWRMAESGSWRFAFIGLLALANLIVITRVIFPGADAA